MIIASTCISLTVVALVTFYSLILNVMAPELEDLLHFIVRVPAIFYCAVLSVTGICLAVISLFIAVFVVYSFNTAVICVPVGLLPIIVLIVYYMRLHVQFQERIDTKLASLMHEHSQSLRA